MGIEALTRRNDGTLEAPTSHADWESWAGATDIRNFMLRDPVVDWLELYGAAAGFQRDTELPTFDKRTSLPLFVFRQSAAFEDAVASHIGTRLLVQRLSQRPDQVRDVGIARATFSAMQNGVPVIHRGVLWDAEHRLYGVPDLLVRSDKLRELFPGAISEEEASQPAPGLGDGMWHYVVVDIKFERLPLNASGGLSNSGSARAHKAQLFIYNQALGRIQGLLADHAFLLGRGWELESKGVKHKSDSCMDRLAPVSQTESGVDGALKDRVVAAVDWIRQLRAHGSSWQVLPKPSVSELWPNMKNEEDFPWHAAKAHIADQLGELTKLLYVGPERRDAGHQQGVYSWRDPKCTAAMVGVKGAAQGAALQAILEVNHSNNNHPVRPTKVSVLRSEWHKTPPLEFYVDFETVNDLADDFTNIPNRGSQPLIFMIGCGHIENGEWLFRCFIADSLTEPAEALIINEWYEHMEEVKKRLCPPNYAPRIIHWWRHEPGSLETDDASAFNRHPGHKWAPSPWFDFLIQVVQKEPVVVRGAFEFGLKDVAKAMKSLGLIKTQWDEGPADGSGAMAGAWWCAEEAARLGKPLKELDLMQDIAKYNEVDCKVMMEIVRYLRDYH